MLVDREGVVRLWNPAAARITGLDSDEVARAADRRRSCHGWEELARRIPVTEDPGAGARRDDAGRARRPRALALGLRRRLDEGIVYAFRDLTEERALEQMRSDFVATVSHELRTPLAAIYGAALTILRPDLELDDELHEPPSRR